MTPEQRKVLEQFSQGNAALVVLKGAASVALADLDQARADVLALEGVVRDAIEDHFEGVPFAVAGEREWFLTLLEVERDRLKRQQDERCKFGRRTEADALQPTIDVLGRVLDAVKMHGPARPPLSMERLERENEALRAQLEALRTMARRGQAAAIRDYVHSPVDALRDTGPLLLQPGLLQIMRPEMDVRPAEALEAMVDSITHYSAGLSLAPLCGEPQRPPYHYGTDNWDDVTCGACLVLMSSETAPQSLPPLVHWAGPTHLGFAPPCGAKGPLEVAAGHVPDRITCPACRNLMPKE